MTDSRKSPAVQPRNGHNAKGRVLDRRHGSGRMGLFGPWNPFDTSKVVNPNAADTQALGLSS